MSKKLYQGKRMAAIVVIVLAMLVGIMPWCIKKTSAQPAKPVTLIFESFVPPSPPVEFAKAFGKGLEDATGGMFKTEYHIGGSMGPPGETPTHLIKGICDWAEFNPGYTPGMFPMSEIFELPIVYPTAEVISRAMLAMYKKGYFDKEFADIKFLWFYGIGPYQLFSNKKATTVAEIKGLKIRCPHDGFVAMSKALGGVPVTVKGVELYTAMQKGITDTTWACGDMADAFKLREVSKYVIMTDIGNAVMAFGMNRKVFDGLPQAGKKWIEDNSESFYVSSGKRFTETNALGIENARKAGAEIYALSDAEMVKLHAALVPLFDKWVAEKEAKGLPAKKALSDLYQILRDLGVKNPFPAPK